MLIPYYFLRMSVSGYTQTFPTLQKTTFWSNYMAALKGQLKQIKFYCQAQSQLQFNWNELALLPSSVLVGNCNCN